MPLVIVESYCSSDMDKTITSATGIERKTWPKLLRRVGVLLLLLALLAPPHWNFSNGFYVGGGFMALLETPVWALVAVTKGIRENYWQGYLLGLSMMIGWISNFCIFLRMPKIATIFAIASPWVLFIGVTFLENVTGISTVALSFVPFYPWAVGIALIQWSKLAETEPKGEIRSTWTGF
jgi:hypothetical protein